MTTNLMNDLPWVEEFRPATIADMVLPTAMKGGFTKIINKTKPFPNMMFSSISPGTGKTTIAKAIPRMLGLDSCYINVSLERGIDTLRDGLQTYASGQSYDDNIKVVILDEFDGATKDLQKALRGFVEQFILTCRFIITCNFVNQILNPVQSRFEQYDFSFSGEASKKEMELKIFKHLMKILDAKKISYDKSILVQIVVKFYPDIRSMIMLLDNYAGKFGQINKDILNVARLDQDFYNLVLNGQVREARKYVLDCGIDYANVYRDLFDNLLPQIPNDADNRKKARAIVTIEEYMNKFTNDPEITLCACLVELHGIWS